MKMKIEEDGGKGREKRKDKIPNISIPVSGRSPALPTINYSSINSEDVKSSSQPRDSLYYITRCYATTDCKLRPISNEF